MAGKTFRRTRKADPVFFAVEADDGRMIRFDCRESIPGGIALDFANLVGEGEDATQQGLAALGATKRLLNAAIEPAQHEQFWAMVNGESPDGVIDISMLMEIAEALGEEYTARPTGQSSPNGSPGTTSGSPSTAGAPPAVPMYQRSPQYERSTS